MVAPCPVCGQEGGFHDHDAKESKHAQHEVPRELLLDSGWAKEAHAELKREQAEQVAVLAAEIDDDKQQWFIIRGLPVLVKGTRSTERVEISLKCQCVMFEEDEDVNYDLPVCECGHVSDEHDDTGACTIGNEEGA